MAFLGSILYAIFLRIYLAGINFGSLINEKAKLWVEGRNQSANFIRDQAKVNAIKGAIWFHCASLGEFEQARPLIEETRRRHPEKKILLTFFSPSGYEVRKDYALADAVLYLPFDVPADIYPFIDSIKPELVIFVRYEFWINTLTHLQTLKIPVYLVSASFRPTQIFFKPYGDFFRRALQAFTQIFTIDTDSAELLKQIGITNVKVCGDTRLDRVASIAMQNKELALVSNFVGTEEEILIAGSTWEDDLQVLVPLLQNFPDLKMIIAPHHIHESAIHHTESHIGVKSVRYTALENGGDTGDARVLIIDNMGMLAFVYKYAKYCYIGGGFGISVHNVPEAAVYGKPVFFGPHHLKARECGELINAGAAYCIRSSAEIENHIIGFIKNEESYLKSATAAKNHVLNNTGAAAKIMREINL